MTLSLRPMVGTWVALAALALGCASPNALSEIPEEAPPAAKEPAADTIYLGTIVTVDGDGRLAEAVAVKDGRILLVGDEGDVLAHRGRETAVVDLAGSALLPGFIDPHSHIASHGVMVAGWANVSQPPVGGVESLPDLIAALEAHAEHLGAGPGDWIVGYGYDKDGLAERREVTRDDLDAHFPDNPVALIHVSSHGAVLNSKAFERVGIDAGTPTPPGGVIARKPGSQEPAGLLMEVPFFTAMQALPQPTLEAKVSALATAQQHYAANGYTTVQDGASGPGELELLQRAAAERRLFLDVVALPTFQIFPSLVAQPDVVWGAYRDRLKLGGVKTLLDGSPQGRTAYFIEPMVVPGPAGQSRWRGEPILSQTEVDGIFSLALEHGVQTYTHANGDAAIDMLLTAWESIGAPTDRRPVVIHSQFVRPEQLAAYARIGAVPSFFTNHAFFWGDVHVENLGERRAFFLSPLRSASDRGLHFTNHSDYAVTPLDPMFMLWSATERVSRSGVVIGPEERVSIAEALRALTSDAAYQYFEEDEKGSIENGKLADFVILDRNPLDAPGEELRAIRVLETIKEGETVWRAAGGEAPEGEVVE
jgi:predicted amidohydrolase YtcJ